jgi:hypothetical protein
MNTVSGKYVNKMYFLYESNSFAKIYVYVEIKA